MEKVLILDVVTCPRNLREELDEWAAENEMGQNSYRELDFRFFDEGELPLTEAYIRKNNPENLPVYLHFWW